jgi:AraC-like DNA-binding protein
LRTKVLTTLDPPLVQDKSSSHGKIWLLLIPFSICALGFAWWWKRKHKVESETLPVAEQTLSPSEEEFLQRIIQHINEHISDEGYGIRALSSDMCMSRANLYRKVRSLTGQSPTDFISNHRLERAAELLRTTNYTVNEVADMVGFSYATYFTRCFKKKYGVPPKDFK